jgi:hypothetical protein
MSNGSGDIIIKGGSVQVEFDDIVYQRDPAYLHRYSNDDRKITRIVITGDMNFDSGDHPDGLRCDITVLCR